MKKLDIVNGPSFCVDGRHTGKMSHFLLFQNLMFKFIYLIDIFLSFFIDWILIKHHVTIQQNTCLPSPFLYSFKKLPGGFCGFTGKQGLDRN